MWEWRVSGNLWCCYLERPAFDKRRGSAVGDLAVLEWSLRRVTCAGELEVPTGTMVGVENGRWNCELHGILLEWEM